MMFVMSMVIFALILGIFSNISKLAETIATRIGIANTYHGSFYVTMALLAIGIIIGIALAPFTAKRLFNHDLLAPKTPPVISGTRIVPRCPNRASRWKHVKRGTYYIVDFLAEGKGEGMDGKHYVIYHAVVGYGSYARELAEFMDGRFVQEELPNV